MYYSSFGILALIIHLIINHDILKKHKNEPENEAKNRCRLFLISLVVFYLSDILRGFAVDTRITVLAYTDTVMFLRSWHCPCCYGQDMSFFIVIQTLNAFIPFYTIGCLIANCFIHVFVEEDEKRDNERITADAKKEKERTSISRHPPSFYVIYSNTVPCSVSEAMNSPYS